MLMQWTINMDEVVALFRLVCQVEPSERRDVVMVGGRICCVWMVLMVLCYWLQSFYHRHLSLDHCRFFSSNWVNNS